MKFLEERAHRPQGDFAYFMHIKKKRVCTRKSGSAAQQKTGCIRGIPGYVYQCPKKISSPEREAKKQVGALRNDTQNFKLSLIHI